MKEFYLEKLQKTNFENVIEEFHKTLIDTNRSLDFFVDWKKVKKNVEKYKIELNILNSLIGSKQFDYDLKRILNDYNKVLPAIPLLLAIRERNFKVIHNFTDENLDIKEHDFRVRKLSEKEIDNIIDFFDKTGLKRFFLEMGTKSIQDYLYGVEVGLDTHARKNRSGNAMELLLQPIISDIVKDKNKFEAVLYQKKFKYLEKNYNKKIDSSIKDRKADFIIIKKNKKIINIEVNFFSGTGSKPQEIVDAYIQRQSDLKNNGLEFIWITDGDGWRGQRNQIHKGFENIDYLLNLHFVRVGLLEEILCMI